MRCSSCWYCSTRASNAEREPQAASVSVATLPWRSWIGIVMPCRIPNSLASSKNLFCLLLSSVSDRSVDQAKGRVVAIDRAITGSILSYRFAQYCFTQGEGYVDIASVSSSSPRAAQLRQEKRGKPYWSKVLPNKRSISGVLSYIERS